MTAGPAPASVAAAAGARRIVELARAKVNLTLEVLGRRADGYHELASLVAFADTGDRLSLTEADAWSFACHGPTAASLTGENLVERASLAVRNTLVQSATGSAELYKVLPVAGGIGGGSADAAALLRALRQLSEPRHGDADWHRIAVGIGADVPVCLHSRLSFMRGLGELVDPLDLTVGIPAVLVNPGTPLSTARVFAELAAPPLPRDGKRPPPPSLGDLAGLLDWVCAGRNDLEAPALRLAPEIGRVRAALNAMPGCRVARMSGSGPTCFGLFETNFEADRAASAISRTQPYWWVCTTSLG